MNAIYILWLREIKRYLRSRVQIFVSLAQPAFFLLVWGLVSAGFLGREEKGSYLFFMPPGIVGAWVPLSSVSAGVPIFGARQFGFLKAPRVAPAPRLYIMIGRTLGG